MRRNLVLVLLCLCPFVVAATAPAAPAPAFANTLGERYAALRDDLLARVGRRMPLGNERFAMVIEAQTPDVDHQRLPLFTGDRLLALDGKPILSAGTGRLMPNQNLTRIRQGARDVDKSMWFRGTWWDGSRIVHPGPECLDLARIPATHPAAKDLRCAGLALRSDPELAEAALAAAAAKEGDRHLTSALGAVLRLQQGRFAEAIALADIALKSRPAPEEKLYLTWLQTHAGLAMGSPKTLAALAAKDAPFDVNADERTVLDQLGRGGEVGDLFAEALTLKGEWSWHSNLEAAGKYPNNVIVMKARMQQFGARTFITRGNQGWAPVFAPAIRDGGISVCGRLGPSIESIPGMPQQLKVGFLPDPDKTEELALSAEVRVSGEILVKGPGNHLMTVGHLGHRVDWHTPITLLLILHGDRYALAVNGVERARGRIVRSDPERRLHPHIATFGSFGFVSNVSVIEFGDSFAAPSTYLREQILAMRDPAKAAEVLQNPEDKVWKAARLCLSAGRGGVQEALALLQEVQRTSPELLGGIWDYSQVEDLPLLLLEYGIAPAEVAPLFAGQHRWTWPQMAPVLTALLTGDHPACAASADNVLHMRIGEEHWAEAGAMHSFQLLVGARLVLLRDLLSPPGAPSREWGFIARELAASDVPAYAQIYRLLVPGGDPAALRKAMDGREHDLIISFWLAIHGLARNDAASAKPDLERAARGPRDLWEAQVARAMLLQWTNRQPPKAPGTGDF